MDFNEIKNLIQQEGGKIIIVENGKPLMVVLSFEDFKARTLRQAQGKAVTQAPSLEQNEEELTIDDLPL